MRIFTRYILREVASYSLLGGVLFTFVLFMRDLPKILDLLVRDSASLSQAARIFADMLPNTLTFTIPAAVLAGVLLGLSRLAADSEVTAMRACGIGAFTFVRIVSILSFTALGVGLVNALYFAPHGAADLLKLENELKSSQASVAVEPRVFYEDFKDYVLYVQDVRAAAGASVWNHVFLADLTQPANPDVITANQAIVPTSGNGDSQTVRLHLIDGGKHEITPTNPDEYTISTFAETDVPLQFDTQDDTHISRSNTRIQAISFAELSQRARGFDPDKKPIAAADVRAARIELNTRFSYPFACLVLMLIGVPLGLSSKRGGKSTGSVLTLLLFFAYYLVSNVGVAFAKSGKVSPFLGVWGANIIFAAFGLLLLQQLAGGGILLNFFTSLGATLEKKVAAIAPNRIVAALSKLTSSGPSDTIDAALNVHASGAHPSQKHAAKTLIQRMRSQFKTSFPLLLDEYVMRSYAANFVLSLCAFALLYVVFTFFELMGDIIRNQTPFIIVGEYLVNLIPFIVNAVTPLCSLLAVLITFGALNRSSELTAMKATGISLYRVVAPILVVAAVLAVALFAFDESYLPQANRRQEELRSQIKDRPAQTFLNPDRKWISGQTGPAGTPTRIFYYQAFDLVQDRYVFANLFVFEFDPQTFTLQRRIFASSVRWDPTVNQWIFDNGWQRSFSGEAITPGGFHTFSVATFPEIREPPSWFKKEFIPSQEMTYGQLDKYIAELRQSGFPDTIMLEVQLANKISVPAITLVMAILAVPFAVSMGKRGGLAGIATAIGVAISYWFVSLTFSSMGGIGTLPPLLAAWSPDLLFAIAGSYLLLRTPT